MRSKTWTDGSLREDIKKSKGIREAIIKISLTSTSSSYKQIDQYIKKNNIDISHFNGYTSGKQMRHRKWSEQELKKAVYCSTSIRQVIQKLGLIPAGGNYLQVQKYIKICKLDISHFKGQGWNKGKIGIGKPLILLKDILIKNSNYQSYSLKKRLYKEDLKKPKCEDCGWARQSKDGRLPLELDHINGDNKDNRLKNLRILCPNCHSLKPTHRGMNKGKK
ncbi:hypothetical protein COW81_01540 [Candidatus Campbellbacteria bacterium CG22_combo_CG10-13_8_21_14_all_36_13]|uniref:HNH nuclease domain-containing protein n=1 Tax=Candidatus Campbellbacteria bacterium CG22_combo_CG10-13_8_21_14_all_36_13 TaxID=1974529 RepID=A0A2H0DYE0_9BACT|nr:MAG: hypothetical protein COW81_01540 [Candidatus Campbellbacteria bacterium CG22_combo_CG10-13_8_21_14_all_36_13]